MIKTNYKKKKWGTNTSRGEQTGIDLKIETVLFKVMFGLIHLYLLDCFMISLPHLMYLILICIMLAICGSSTTINHRQPTVKRTKLMLK